MTKLGEANPLYDIRWLFLTCINGILKTYQLSWFLLRCLLEEYIHLCSEQLSSLFLHINQERI